MCVRACDVCVNVLTTTPVLRWLPSDVGHPTTTVTLPDCAIARKQRDIYVRVYIYIDFKALGGEASTTVRVVE